MYEENPGEIDFMVRVSEGSSNLESTVITLLSHPHSENKALFAADLQRQEIKHI